MKFLNLAAIACVTAFAVTTLPATAQTTATMPMHMQMHNSAEMTTSTGAKKEKVIVLNNADCPVSGENIADSNDGDAKKAPSVTYKGYEVDLCCKKCVKTFNADPDKYLEKAKESAPKASRTKKELTVLNNADCPISGKATGSMEKGANVVYKGYKVGLCCTGCTEKFNADPDAYLSKLLSQQKAADAPVDSAM